MAKSLPLIAFDGALVFLAVYIALGSGSKKQTSKRTASRFSSFREGAFVLLEYVGAALPQRIAEGRVCAALADEFRHLDAVRKLGISDASYRGVLGAIEASVLLAAAVGTLFLGVLPGALVGIAAVPVLLLLRLSRRKKLEQQHLEQAMPEAFSGLAMSLASGRSLPQSMRFVGSHSEEPIRSEFLRVSYGMECGESATDALDDLLQRLEAPGLDLVALALKVSRRTGAPLKDLLADASEMVGERIELKRRLDVKTAQARMSAHIVAAMPALMMALLSLFSSDFRRGIVTTTGAVSVAVALVLNLCALLSIRKIMRVDL